MNHEQQVSAAKVPLREAIWLVCGGLAVLGDSGVTLHPKRQKGDVKVLSDNYNHTAM